MTTFTDQRASLDAAVRACDPCQRLGVRDSLSFAFCDDHQPIADTLLDDIAADLNRRLDTTGDDR